MDEIYDQAAEARRSLKATIGGRKAPATLPGGLRDNVLANLQTNPGAEFTPHQIHNVLANSSGATANALDTLVNRGEAELSCETPPVPPRRQRAGRRRYHGSRRRRRPG